MRNMRRAFTLVELLVVIGIISILIAILLPALNKAREQANAVACESNERQFFNCVMLYADDFQGTTLPCYYQAPNAEIDWWQWQILGIELGKGNTNGAGSAGGYTGGTGGGNQANGMIVHQVLTCPSQSHIADPGYYDQTNHYYFGDYIYNYYMGVSKYNATTGVQDIYAPAPKLSEIPANVIIMAEGYKPNDARNTTGAWAGPPAGYKDYFQSWGNIVNNTANGVNRGSTPHNGGRYMNVLAMDGHISLINPFTDTLVQGQNANVVVNYTTFPPKYIGTPVFMNWLCGPGPQYTSAYNATDGATASYDVGTPAQQAADAEAWNKYAPALP